MSRLVQPAQRIQVASNRSGGHESTGQVEIVAGGDNYLDRVTKYIPSEVLAAYLALDRTWVPSTEQYLIQRDTMAATAAKAAGAAREPSAQAALSPELQYQFFLYMPLLIAAVCVVFVPIYIWQLAQNAGDKTPWKTHAVVSSLAFLVWAYAIQGSVFTAGPMGNVFHGSFASTLLILFTLASGVFAPRTRVAAEGDGGVPAIHRAPPSAPGPGPGHAAAAAAAPAKGGYTAGRL